MGRWDKLKKKYPALPATGTTEYRDRLKKQQRAYRSCSLPALLAELEAQRTRREELEAARTEVNVRLEALSQTLVELFEDQNLRSVKTRSGNTVFLKAEPYPSVEDRTLFEAYISKHPDLDYLYAVQPQTLRGLVCELLEEGRDAEIPPGLKIFIKTSVQLRRS